MQYVYLLMCSNNRPYTGCTHDLKKRLILHTKGYVPATKEIRPVRLVSYIAFKDKYKAYNFEKYLKSGSGRTFTKRHFLQ